MLIVALALHLQQAPAGSDVFGKYLQTNMTTKPECTAPGEKYLVISPKSIAWDDGRVDDIVSLEIGANDHYHLWVKDGKSGKAVVYGIYVDKRYDRAIVVSDERAMTQAQIDQPNAYDIGVVGYARCPS